MQIYLFLDIVSTCSVFYLLAFQLLICYVVVFTAHAVLLSLVAVSLHNCIAAAL